MLKIDQLEKIVKNFLEEAILLLQKYNVEGQFKPDDEPFLIKLKNGGRKWTVRKRRRYSYNLTNYEKEIRNLKSYKTLEDQITAIANDIDAKKNTKGFSLSQYIYNKSYPVEILWTALNKQRKIPQLSPTNFQEIIKGLKEILLEKKVSVINIALLSPDFDFKKSRVLDDNRSFKYFSLKELSALYNEASLKINFLNVSDCLERWATVVIEKVPLNELLSYSYDAAKKLREIILSVRLCEDSFITDRIILSRLIYKTGLLRNFEGYRYTRFINKMSPDLYLQQKKLPHLKKIKNSVKLISDSDGLNNPLLRRFLNAPERRNIEDGLLDLIIILEGMLVPEEHGGSISYKFALRATAICNKYRITIKNVSRGKYFRWFKSLYYIRSELVHGSRKKGKNEVTKFIEKYEYSSITDVFQSAYFITRNILTIYLKENWAKKSSKEEKENPIDRIILKRIEKKNRKLTDNI